MKEIGEFLKLTRQQNGVSLEEASDDLNVSKDELENLEEGNVRAFKDVYELKEMVKDYSKYLGIDSDKTMDEFNDFMFEHTSKISLDDIKEARKKTESQEVEPKVLSPYSYIPKQKKSIKDIGLKKIMTFLIILLIIIFFVLLWNFTDKEDNKITEELMGRTCDIYEYTN